MAALLLALVTGGFVLRLRLVQPPCCQRADDLVRRHTLPEGAAAPDVVVQEQAVHACYQRSEAAGRWWSWSGT